MLVERQRGLNGAAGEGSKRALLFEGGRGRSALTLSFWRRGGRPRRRPSGPLRDWAQADRRSPAGIDQIEPERGCRTCSSPSAANSFHHARRPPIGNGPKDLRIRPKWPI